MGAKEFAQELLSDLKSVMGGMEIEQAAARINPNKEDGAVTPGEVRAKGMQDAKQAAIGNFADNNKLAQNVWDLQVYSKSYQGLGWDKSEVLQNPTSLFRAKKADGSYVIPNWKLNQMICTLMASGSSHESQKWGRKPSGIPLDEWAAKSGSNTDAVKTGIANGFEKAAVKGGLDRSYDMVSKDLATTGSGANLIRTDLEPLLYEAYLRSFPAAEAIPQEPANGVNHTYNVRTAPPTAATVSEVGSFSGLFTNSTIAQRQSAVAVIVAPVGVGLKLQYAVQQSGMDYNISGSNNLEVIGALTGIAKKDQSMFLQGNATTSGKVYTDEEGNYVATDYTGLRLLLKGASNSINKGSTQTYINVINKAIAQLGNAGADISSILLLASLNVQTDINDEFVTFLRDINGNGGMIDSARATGGFKTVGGWDSKIVPIPMQDQTTYTDGPGAYTFSAATVEDITVLDPATLSRIYLGSATPTILELPVGYNNILSNVYVPFFMSGLALKLPEFNRKIRVPRVTV